ncbi:40S ribosomal protein S7 [Dendrobium catenatum]|uniref:40S ribosomal protein S7 n=1 Tax=Dendrobium catenatum TaxID=906689 RepID=A0A2I0XGU7_9ASPA|nr:40S ribosomal protein S7 [Dendrobium catenatum]
MISSMTLIAKNDHIMQIFLDPKERNNTEYKLETFSGVYRKLCGKDVVFEYPVTESA